MIAFEIQVQTAGARAIALAFVKRAWRITPAGLERDTPAPLAHPMHESKRIVPGSDYWSHKAHTDVVVVGSVRTPELRPMKALVGSIAVGERVKRVRATGLRQVSWRTGELPRFPDPEPFTEVPLAYGNAYGGLDARVVDPSREPFLVEGVPLADHPGMYPRNPFGRGYVVSPEGADEVDLPFLEDPDDLLTPERLIVGDPSHWHRQPLPAGLGWIHPWMFPRALLFDVRADAWFPAPDDNTLREVRSGILPEGFRALLRDHQRESGPHEGFFQESSIGLRFSGVPAGAPITLEHLHPAHPTQRFAAPPPSTFTWRFEGALTPAVARLHHLVIEPDALRVSCTWVTELELPRAMIPGVHAHIPLALRVDEQWCPYEAPKTVIAGLREAGVDPLSMDRG